jgi:hypothetical protein
LIEESGIPDRHASFDAMAFGFNRRRNHTPVGPVIRCHHNRLSEKQGIGLLFNGGKAGIEVNVHDGWLVAIDGKWHTNDNCILFANIVRTYNESITQRLKSQGL